MAHPIRLLRPDVRPARFVPDAAQRTVIEHDHGNLRVLAGPGTGKTSVIVEAVQRRIRAGQAPGSILLLTYGRLAARELRTRLTTGDGPVPVATTFHALALRLVQAHDPHIRLMGAPEQETVLRDILATSQHLPAELEGARRSRGLTEQMRAFISGAQARAAAPGEVVAEDPLTAGAAGVYAEYLDILGLAGTVDYAELIARATDVVRLHAPRAVRELRTIYVDEYQDTDPAQIALLKELAAHGAQVVAVGDPDQSIYGFRGADADGILEFDEMFGLPSCTTIALGATRRFGPEIAEVAARVVPKNALPGIGVDAVLSHRAPQPAGDPAGRTAFRVYESEAAQADHLADLLRRVHAGASEVFPGMALPWSDMAVLVRSGRRDLPVLQRALLAAGIPVEIARDDVPLAATPAVRPLLDVLRVAGGVDGGLTAERAVSLLVSPLGGLDARRVARLGREVRRRAAGVGDVAPASSHQLIADAVRDPAAVDGMDRALAEPVVSLSGIIELACKAAADGVSPARILDQVWRATSWPAHLRREALAGGRRAREANQALDAVMELFDQAERMDRAFESVRSVADFLNQLDEQVIPAAPDLQRSWNRDAVRLLTAHRAKGSQWSLVVVAGVQEGLWPDVRPRAGLFGRTADAGWREQRMLEERRLFFVACTRASLALLVTAVDSSADDGPTPSTYLGLAAGNSPVVSVPGRPGRPLTPVGVVAGLRQILVDPQSSPALRASVWERIQGLREVTDARGQHVFPWADPQTWWGHRTWTQNPTPWFDPDSPLPMSASGIDAYVKCPRRWFLEKRAAATQTASTRLAFGNLLHLCAQAIAAGDLPPEEAEVQRVLDSVWHAVGYEPGWQSRFERDQAQQATVRLLTWLRQTPGEFLGAEIEFSQEVDLPSGESLRVNGTVDRLDRVAGQVMITDFKTGKKITKEAAAGHIQMGLYRWVAELGGLGEAGRAVAQLLFLRDDPPRGQREPGARVMRQDAPDLGWLPEILDAAAAGVRAEIAVARPADGCRTCPMADSCPADPRGAEVRP